jgi:hypothetical protein
MEEDLVTYQIALKLKEKGFDIPCEMYYHIHDDIEDSIMSLESTGGWCDFYNSKNRYRCAAPDIPQVLKWLRKEKSIYVTVYVGHEDWFEYRIVQLINNKRCSSNHVYKTYDDAILAGIEYVLNNNLI